MGKPGQGRVKAKGKGNAKVKSQSSSPRSAAGSPQTLNIDYAAMTNEARFLNLPPSERLIVPMDANDFTLAHVHAHGIKRPILFTGQKDVLGIQIPDFEYRGVLDKIPPGTQIDIFNQTSGVQKSMPVEVIVNALEKSPTSKRNGPYNMLSMETSDYEIGKHIAPPKIVRQLDWAYTVFPHEKFQHRSYGKVEKYVLMTMGGCYTDFHVDFGGTSVWYHVQKGEKDFFLIEPTDHNMRLFEEWIQARNSGDATGFLGDIVAKCECVHMKPGNTLILPGGWIHAVYTPCDSLVYGGNFLHEWSIPTQLKVRDYEERSQVKKKFKYPYYEQTVWYFVARIVLKATGRNYVGLVHSSELEELLAAPKDADPNRCFDVVKQEWGTYDQYTGEPWQSEFDEVDKILNEPPDHFDDSYLINMSRCFRHDIYLLRIFLNRVFDNRNRKKDTVAEGIRRPRHLLWDFDRVIARLNELHESMNGSPVELPPISPAVAPKEVDGAKVSNGHVELTKPADDEQALANSTAGTLYDDPNIELSGSSGQPSIEADVSAENGEEERAERADWPPENPLFFAPREVLLQTIPYLSPPRFDPRDSDDEMPAAEEANVQLEKEVNGNIPDPSPSGSPRKRPPSDDRNPNGTSTSRGSVPKPAKKPKHRQNESSLPPAISNDAPAADDPVLSAIPLGRGRVPQKTSWRAPPVSSVPKRAGFQPPPVAPASEQSVAGRAASSPIPFMRIYPEVEDPSPVPARIPQTEEQALSNFNAILGLVNRLPDP